MLTPKNKAQLKKLANHLKPQMNLGKGEIDANVITSINNSLEAHELIKIKVLQNSNEMCSDMADIIVSKTGCELVDIIGRTLILYKPSKKNPRIIL